MEKIIVMGINTFAIVSSKSLPGRKCIVISHTKYQGTMAVHAGSIKDALSVEHCFPEIVVIGGASIYAQTIDLADKLVITHVDANTNADTFFPTIDLATWKINSLVDGHNELYNYKFVEYVRHESI
jgi:dihydrofolate reductase